MEITLLKEEQIFGEDRLKIFDEYGPKAVITDFAILLGGYVCYDNYYVRYDSYLKNRTGYYWTSTKCNKYVLVVKGTGYASYEAHRCYVGVRPALPYSSISNICLNVVRDCDEILEVEYSEYPQRVASKILQIELENAYQNNEMSIKKAGKTYTTDSRKCYEYGKKFNAQKHEEFEYKGKKYVRIKANSFYGGDEFTLSNGERYKDGNYVWVEVLPIKWLVDIEKDIALSEKILFAGISFDIKKRYDGNFKETFMYNYLNTIFIKDIQVQQKQVQPKEIKISVIKEKSERELILEKLEKDKQKILSLRINLGKWNCGDYKEITLLKEEQIFGENRLKTFDKYGRKATITDFAVLLGGHVSNFYYYNNSNPLEDRTGCYFTSSASKNNYACFVNESGYINTNIVSSRCGGVRPVLSYSVIRNISSNVGRECDEILEVEYGEYPQKAVSKELQEELECKYNQNSIKKTGKKYTTDSRKYDAYFKRFNAQEHEEFKYKEKRYVRVKANLCYNEREFTLSNGEKYKDGDYVWVEISPIKWLVDIEKDIALSERILFTGIQFDNKWIYNGNFKETFMYKYLNTIFIKDIQIKQKEIEISVIEEKSERELILEKLEKDKQKILSLRRNLVNKR